MHAPHHQLRGCAGQCRHGHIRPWHRQAGRAGCRSGGVGWTHRAGWWAWACVEAAGRALPSRYWVWLVTASDHIMCADYWMPVLNERASRRKALWVAAPGHHDLPTAAVCCLLDQLIPQSSHPIIPPLPSLPHFTPAPCCRSRVAGPNAAGTTPPRWRHPQAWRSCSTAALLIGSAPPGGALRVGGLGSGSLNAQQQPERAALSPLAVRKVAALIKQGNY